MKRRCRSILALVLACCTPSCNDGRLGPARSGKARGTILKYDSIDIKLGYRWIVWIVWMVKKSRWPWDIYRTAWQPRVKSCTWKGFSVTKISISKIIRRKKFRPRCTWAKKAITFSGPKFCAIWYILRGQTEVTSFIGPFHWAWYSKNADSSYS